MNLERTFRHMLVQPLPPDDRACVAVADACSGLRRPGAGRTERSCITCVGLASKRIESVHLMCIICRPDTRAHDFFLQPVEAAGVKTRQIRPA